MSCQFVDYTADTVQIILGGVGRFLPFRNAYNSSTPLKDTYLEGTRHDDKFGVWLFTRVVLNGCKILLSFIAKILCLNKRIEERRLAFWLISLFCLWSELGLGASKRRILTRNSIYFSAVVLAVAPCQSAWPPVQAAWNRMTVLMLYPEKYYRKFLPVLIANYVLFLALVY